MIPPVLSIETNKLSCHAAGLNLVEEERGMITVGEMLHSIIFIVIIIRLPFSWKIIPPFLFLEKFIYKHTYVDSSPPIHTCM